MRKMYIKSFHKTITRSWCREVGIRKTPGLILMLLFMVQIAFAQTTLVWTGVVDTDALNPANWDPQLDIKGNILSIDSAYKFTNLPVLGGSINDTISQILPAATSIFTIAKSGNASVYISSGNPTYLAGTLKIDSGQVNYRKTLYLEAVTAVVDISGGKLETRDNFSLGKKDLTAGGTVFISGTGEIHTTKVPIRFSNDTLMSVVTITDNGKFTSVGDFTVEATLRVAKNQLISGPNREIVVEYDLGSNLTTIYSRSTMVLLVEPVGTQKITAKAEGKTLRVVKNDAWASVLTFDWKYSTTSGSGYVSFSPAQTNDSIVPVFQDQGNYYIVCTGNTGIDELVSNEIKFIVSSDKVSVSPAGKQIFRTGQTGVMLTVTETETPTGREWKYTTTSGEGYVSLSTPQTGVEYTPDFVDPGIYYLICQSVIGAVDHNSNEIVVEVLANNAPRSVIKWTGAVSSDAGVMLNWIPYSYINKTDWAIEAGLTNYPVVSTASNDTIGVVQFDDGATITLAKAINDTLVVSKSDYNIHGEIIVESGVLYYKDYLRLDNNTGTLTVKGGKVVHQQMLIMGQKDGGALGGFVNISGDGIVYNKAPLDDLRWATDTLHSVMTITDNGQFITAKDWRGGAETRMAKNQLMTTEGKKLVVDYPVYMDGDTFTVVTAVDKLAFAIEPADKQIVAVDEQASELSTLNDEDRIGFEWKYTTTPGSGYMSFDPKQVGVTCLPSFNAAGSYYVVCEAYSDKDTVKSNEVNIMVVSVSIAPTETQNIAPAEEGTPLTVTESIAADSREWKYSTTSGSGYVSIPGTPTGTSWTPLFVLENTYYVVCVSNFDSKAITSNEVTVVVKEVAVEDVEANTISMYPNPAQDKFYISAPNTDNFTVHMVDMQGRLVLAREFNNATGPQLITVNQTGIYFVKVITGDGIFISKVILE